MRDAAVDLEQMMPLVLSRLSEGGKVRFTPNGISMRPMLEGGRDRVVLVAPPEKLKKYDLPLYKRDSGQYVLHRIVAVGENYTCVGDNQFGKETVRPDQVLAVVESFTRKGKEYALSSLGYRFYCRFWHFSRPLRHFWVRGIGFVKRGFKRSTK